MASASTTADKEQIRDQVGAASPLDGDAVALQLAFVVGPRRRSWPNLWKATIDSLGPILGRDDGASQWNVRDGRITDLGLYCAVDPAAGHKITIAIRASPPIRRQPESGGSGGGRPCANARIAYYVRSVLRQFTLGAAARP